MSYEKFQRGSRSEQNCFSFWWEKVKDCGIPVPQTVVVQTPEDLRKHFCLDNYDEDMAAIKRWVKEAVEPALEASPLKNHLLFVKNSLFSNKFDARYCMARPGEDLAWHITNIQYAAMCCMGFGPTGENEFVFREQIRHNHWETPCIYGGLPLRAEFRVFYDFDAHKVIFTANYWDYDYCYPHLYDRTDRIVFDAMRKEIEEKFQMHREKIESLVEKHMKNVEGLTGPWSVDILLNEATHAAYLIDMAVAEESAYWELRPQEFAENTDEEVR